MIDDLQPQEAGWREGWRPHNQPADIPQGATGKVTLNPERWGIWPACDRTLWAWRHLHRMAELARLADCGDHVARRYELLPALCSYQPNLEVYRQLGVPVFVPTPQHVFLVLRMPHLRWWCFGAVCVRENLLASTDSRMLMHIRWQRNPLETAAAELHFQAENVGEDAAFPRAFQNLRSTNPAVYQQWLDITQAVLDTSLLGLPVELQRHVINHEYGLDLPPNRLTQLVELLAEHVVYELRLYREDRIAARLAARQGHTAQQMIYRIARQENAAGANRSNLNGQAGRGARRLHTFRAWTLGGRPTSRATQLDVQRQQVFGTADEVLLEIAFAALSVRG